MGDIRYVSLSDTHFGADNSILTRLSKVDGPVDPQHPSDLLIHLVNCLRNVINANEGHAKPRLILNGDILDLAFSTENVAAMAFRNFLELTMPQDPAAQLFDPNFIFIPGNHDHHLWEICRERRFVDQMRATDWSQPWDKPRHITELRDPEPLTSHFLEAVARSLPWLGDVRVETVYPNLGFLKGDRLVIYTHGHFIENVYLMASQIADLLYPKTPPPATMEEWEAQNFAWIDFVWSVLGRSGRIGPDEEAVYNTANSPKALGVLLGSAVKTLIMSKTGSSSKGIADGIEQLVAAIIEEVFERSSHQSVLSDDGAGLKRFLAIPIQQQIRSDYPDLTAEADITVVFGHTHKPFQARMDIDGFLTSQIDAFNSGGWVVDSPDIEPLIGGAVILMDEDLNIASLRMYNEAPERSDYTVSVRAITDNNPLRDRLSGLINPTVWPWSDFSASANATVKMHNKRLKLFLKPQGD
ncbi:MAG: hypothetical protein AAGB28_12145 [Pseudomonadota bacterium]